MCIFTLSSRASSANMKGISAIIVFVVVSIANGEIICPISEANVILGAELMVPDVTCNKFVTCTHGNPVVQTCPGPLLYNIIERVCDWPQNVDCGDRILEILIPEVPEVEEVDRPDDIVIFVPEPDGDVEIIEVPRPELLPNGCPVDNSIHWLIPHEIRCSRFYECSNRERVLRECPDFLFFNRGLQVCDWPADAGCVSLIPL